MDWEIRKIVNIWVIFEIIWKEIWKNNIIFTITFFQSLHTRTTTKFEVFPQKKYFLETVEG